MIKKLKKKFDFITDKKLREEVVKEEKGDYSDVMEIDYSSFKTKLTNFLGKYWVPLSLFIIFLLGFYIRIFGFNFEYLRNIDSYYFFRYTKTIVETGSLPAVDKLMTAPQGLALDTLRSFYMYLSAYSFKFVQLFKPDLELWRFFIYFPAFLAALTTFPAYYIGKYLLDKKAGILTAFFLVFNPFNMTRSLGGDPDSDCIVILMTTLTMAFFVFTQSKIKEWNKKAMIYSVLTGIVLALFAHTWSGSWYVPWLFVGFGVLKTIFDYVKEKKINKSTIYSIVTIILVLFLLTIPFFGFGYAKGLVEGPLSASQYKSESGLRFPNVWVSIAEMTSPGGETFLQKIGTVAGRVNPYLFILSIFSLLYLGASALKTERHVTSFIFLFLWFVGTLYASIFAVRFIILLSFPVAIAASLFLAKAIRMILGEDKTIFD